jgi:stage III sporulation protein AG
MKTDTKKLTALLKSDKAVKIIVAAGFALILLILFSELFSLGRGDERSTSRAPAQAESTAQSAQQLEERLAEIISEISGVGSVKVMVTLESSGQVRGVAIVCEGGDDVLVKQKVVETVSKVLGISTARVSVVY